MSGRLGLSGAYNRQRTLSPIQQANQPSNMESSATFAKLTKENKVLKETNRKMKKELEETRLALKQVFSESSHEKFDERRINLIKFQIVQLERQIATMSEALGFRTDAILEAENSLAWVANKFRSYITCETKGPTVSVGRSDLMTLLETSESARIKLFKSIEKGSKEEVGKQILLLNPFIDQKKFNRDSLSILDVSLNHFKYLNLQHVSQLESKLSVLYKDLIGVHELMQVTGCGRLCQGEASEAECARLDSKLLKCCANMRTAADDLLALSLLCPSAPWPVLKRPLTKEVPIERAIASLPPLPKSKQEEVFNVLKSSVGICNHRYHLLEKERAALKEELIFHRTVYEFQLQYTRDLFDSVRKAYNEFEESVRTIVCEPLKALLEIFSKLKKSASERALRDFLVKLKENEKELTSVVKLFDKQAFQTNSEGAEAFVSLEVDFITKLDLLAEQCRKERDKIMHDKRKIKEEQASQDRELQLLIEELEAKYEKQWVQNKSQKLELDQESSFVSDQSESPRNQAKVVTSHGKNSQQTSRTDDSSFLSGRERPSDSVIFMMKSETSDKSHNSTRKSATPYEESSFVLRGYLDEDSTWDSNFIGVGTNSEISQKCTDEDARHNLLSESNASSRKTKPTKNRKWQPDKEWNNDFNAMAGLDRPESTGGAISSELFDRSELSGGGTDRNSFFVQNDGERLSSVTPGTSQSTARRSKRNQLRYKPNLAVAQSSLTLKKKVNSSSTVGNKINSAAEESISDDRDFVSNSRSGFR